MILIGLHDLLGHGPGLPIADGCLVHLNDRNDLPCRSGDEHFIGTEKILRRASLLFELDAVCLRNHDHVLARDAFE